MTSKLRFHDFLLTFYCAQLKILMSAKNLAYFWIFSCYFIGIWLKLLFAKFALHWTNIKVNFLKAKIPIAPSSPTYLTSKKASKKSPLPKICHTYPTMMKHGTTIPYLKKIQKIHESLDTPRQLCWHQHVFTGKQQHKIGDTELNFSVIEFTSKQLHSQKQWTSKTSNMLLFSRNVMITSRT